MYSPSMALGGEDLLLGTDCWPTVAKRMVQSISFNNSILYRKDHFYLALHIRLSPVVNTKFGIFHRKI